MYKRFLKSFLDFVIALFAALLLLPVFLIISIAIKIESKGPVIFSQERVGQNRKPYYVYKFRSMIADAEAASGPVWAQDDDPRVTRVGKIIRKLLKM